MDLTWNHLIVVLIVGLMVLIIKMVNYFRQGDLIKAMAKESQDHGWRPEEVAMHVSSGLKQVQRDLEHLIRCRHVTYDEATDLYHLTDIGLRLTQK